jgi:tetratricopeptide (TPR) repeat protein
MDNWRALMRYNFRALMGNSYWLIAVPVAASQLLVLWTMAVAAVWREATVVRSMELLMPILGAFLAAHVLGVEYRSRIGGVIVSKPAPVQRALLVRLAVIFLFLGALMLLTLIGFRFALGTCPLVPALLAGIPPTLFLSMLALTVATMTRSALVGFGVAAVAWALDLIGGVAMNPVLTLQSYSGRMMDHPLTGGWLWNKLLLVVLGLALFELHRRHWLRPEAPFTRRRRVRQGAILATVLLLYVYSGAAYKVGYARAHPFDLPLPTRVWLRSQFVVYGPVPVAWLFGPAFAQYIGHATPWRGGANDPSSLTGASAHLAAMLQAVPDKYPSSIWADPARLDYARLESTRGDAQGAFEALNELATQHPDSPFALAALHETLALARRNQRPKEAMAAAEAILARFPHSSAAYEAGLYAAETYRGDGRLEDALHAAETATPVAPPLERPVALALAAEILDQAGRREEAHTRAEQAMAATRGDIPGTDDRARARAERALAGIRTRMDRLLRN